MRWFALIRQDAVSCAPADSLNPRGPICYEDGHNTLYFNRVQSVVESSLDSFADSA
jgi:hypothetical protein